jgi:hypothetical protein
MAPTLYMNQRGRKGKRGFGAAMGGTALGGTAVGGNSVGGTLGGPTTDGNTLGVNQTVGSKGGKLGIRRRANPQRDWVPTAKED